MFERLKDIFKLDPFVLFILGSVCVIFICGLCNIFTQAQGTWSRYFFTQSYLQHPKPLKEKSKESKGEVECRRVLEDIFNRDFDKARPDFLNNPVTGGNFNLELDCYNPELKLAVEYQGQQHYKFTPYFHKNKEAFLNQKYRDELKRRMCQDNLITLIEVPYTVKPENIRGYLIQELLKRGYILT